MPDGHVISVAHLGLIERHVDVESLAGPFADVVEIALAQIGPKGAVLEPMNRKVKHPKIRQLIRK